MASDLRHTRAIGEGHGVTLLDNRESGGSMNHYSHNELDFGSAKIVALLIIALTIEVATLGVVTLIYFGQPEGEQMTTVQLIQAYLVAAGGSLLLFALSYWMSHRPAKKRSRLKPGKF
jgi:hypothetical protein